MTIMKQALPKATALCDAYDAGLKDGLIVVSGLRARIAELEAALKAVVDDATGYKHPGLNVRQVSFDAIDAAHAALEKKND